MVEMMKMRTILNDYSFCAPRLRQTLVSSQTFTLHHMWCIFLPTPENFTCKGDVKIGAEKDNLKTKGMNSHIHLALVIGSVERSMCGTQKS